MIYGFAIPENNELVIVAGETLDEQQKFLADIEASVPDLIEEQDITRFLTDRAMKDMKRSPAILQFPNGDDLTAFVEDRSIELVSASSGRTYQERMMMNTQFDPNDQRTIAEIHGITDENDPWSTRTDEQKAAAAQRKKKMKDKQQSGEMTGDSYAGGEKKDKEGGLSIQKVNASVDEHGNVIIGDVFAEKGVWNRPRFHVVIPNGQIADYIDLVKRAGLMNENDTASEWEKHPQEGIVITTTTAGEARIREALGDIDYEMVELDNEPIEVSDDWKIADDDLISIYFRVDVPDLTLAVIDPIVAEADTKPFLTRDVKDFGCWLAFMRERAASQTIEALAENGVKAHLAEVDRNGDRIVEEGAGAVVVDTEAEEEEPPLPWNDRAAEFEAMTDKEKAKTLRGKYVLYTVRDYGLPHGRIVHVAPKKIFKDTGRIWEGDFSAIEKFLLPPNIEKMGDAPGRYQCKSLDLNATDYMLGNKAEMKESLNLRMWVNGLPNGDQKAYDRKMS